MLKIYPILAKKMVVHDLKNKVKHLKYGLRDAFLQNRNIQVITQKLVLGTDEILIELFRWHKLNYGNYLCLAALGGYGRQELQLHSDVDLLILYHPDTPTDRLHQVQFFIQDCWDIGLEISHQLTTVSVCAELASQELTVISSLLDIRILCGAGYLVHELLYQTHQLNMWSSYDFFHAKSEEQKARYSKYDDTAYNLEPNVKNGPGGLRDIQILSNIGKRHFGIKKLAEGINCGFITDKEYEELIYCQHYLWGIRFGLHIIAPKKEERLLFDYQIKLADLFGYKDNVKSLAIEQFMKVYFKVIKRTRELNEMLLQWFSEEILHQQKQSLIPLDDAFQLSNHFIEIRHFKAFAQEPKNILRLFLWIAECPQIVGVRASTIRLLRQNLYLITPNFKNDVAVKNLFIKILKADHNPFEALQKMSQYGVLTRYLDCFALVTGQMQYDLFHVYTVDQHTLFVIRNLTRFLNPIYTSQFPLCYQLFSNSTKREILYLAALFHDIAKGRGGDHSTLGGMEAKHFAEQHNLSTVDTHLLIWLVENHLLMSQTAQRQDIYNPKTIKRFCQNLPNTSYLDFLYVLTVADICATNPTLWNAWKDSLLKELFFAAKQFMHHEITLDEKTLAESRQQEALNYLIKSGFKAVEVFTLWEQFESKYFLHETPDMIARHTKAILTCKSFPLVLILPHHSDGGTEVFVYMPHRANRFTITTTVLNNFNATIQEAVILTTKNHFDMDTYIILNDKNQVFFEDDIAGAMQSALEKHLAKQNQLPNIIRRRLSRIQAHFTLKTEISFSTDPSEQYTCLFLVTNDRSGLLAKISHIFAKEKIHLHNAKITTAGERVEDMFYITNDKGQLLKNREIKRLEKEILLGLTQEF